MLSKQTLEHLNDASGNIRAALKYGSINEKPLVVSQLAKLLSDIDHIKSFEQIMDIMEEQTGGIT